MNDEKIDAAAPAAAPNSQADGVRTHAPRDHLQGSLGDAIQTRSGYPFYVCAPRASDVRPADVAWALTQLARYCGHASPAWRSSSTATTGARRTSAT